MYFQSMDKASILGQVLHGHSLDSHSNPVSWLHYVRFPPEAQGSSSSEHREQQRCLVHGGLSAHKAPATVRSQESSGAHGAGFGSRRRRQQEKVPAVE